MIALCLNHLKFTYSEKWLFSPGVKTNHSFVYEMDDEGLRSERRDGSRFAFKFLDINREQLLFM